MADFIDISCKNMRSIIDLIIPVPTNRDRLLQRGFGIPEKMAQVIERRFAIPAFTTVLALARSTANLRGLSKPERKRELKDAFKVRNASLIAGKTVLIIDDVVTYGTTLREVGRTLRRAGVQDVFAIVLAHTESSS
jgi:predicted amidophosphoribosyltransferase